MTLAIAIPMKDPSLCKTRLSGYLLDDTRQQLALALFEHTLAFFRETFPDLPVMVVTASDCIARRSRHLGAGVIDEASANGLNAAAALATDWATQAGYQSLLIVPSDIPVLLQTEIDPLLRLRNHHQVVIAESIDGGTNALLLSPPDCLPFHYGPGSALIHEISAHGRRLSCRRLRPVHLSRDVDTPDDLSVLRSSLPGAIIRNRIDDEAGYSHDSLH